jgi:alpha-1,6-mannosyltransferase
MRVRLTTGGMARFRRSEGSARSDHARRLDVANPAITAVIPQPAPRTARPWWREPYLALGAVLVLFAIGVSVRHPWVGDFGVHAGTIERLRVDLIHPGDPMVADSGPSPYYTPYTIVLGLMARATGWSGRTTLAVAGPLVVIVFLAGLYRFVSVLTPSRPAAARVAVLLTVLLAWGTAPLAWSGFVSLYGLPLTTAYPSLVAIGLTLLLWAGLYRALHIGEPAWWYALLGLGAGVIMLIHPFTGVVAGFGALAIAVAAARERRTWLALGGAVLAAAVVVFSWPYYRFIDLLRAQGYDAIHQPLYAHALGYFGLSAIGLPALWLRWRRDRLDPLVLLFALCGLTVAVGWITGHYALGRAWPGVLLATQIALGIELAGLPWRDLFATRPRGQWAVRVWAAASVLVLAAGLWFQAGNLLLALPASHRLSTVAKELHTTTPGVDLSWVRQQAQVGDVVLTDRAGYLQALPEYGLRTVAPAWPDPSLSDVDTRRADAATMLNAATSAPVRADLLHRYGVKWLLVAKADTRPVGTWGLRLVETGPSGERLYAVE